MEEDGGHNGSGAPVIDDSPLYALFILGFSMVFVPPFTGFLFDLVTRVASVEPPAAYTDTLRTGFGLIAQGAAMVGLTLRRVKGRSPKGLGLSLAAVGLGGPGPGRSWRGEIAAGLIAGIGVTAVNIVGSWLTQQLFGLFMDKDRLAEQVAQESAFVMDLLGSGHSLFIALLLPFVAVVIAPVSEEVFFRGYLYGVLRARRRRDPWYAAYWSSAVFALVHFYVIHFIPVFLIGMVLVFLYRRRGSLIAPIVAHGTANFIVTAATIMGAMAP